MVSYRVGILVDHPTQFEGPFYQYFEKMNPGVLEVIFADRGRIKDIYDPELNKTINWGIDLLSGYNYTVIPARSRITWLRKKIRQSGYNLLIINGYSSRSFIIAGLLGRIYKIPVALRIDTVEFIKPVLYKYVFKRMLYFIFDKIYSHFFVTCSLSKKFILKMGITPSKISLFPYAIDNEFFVKKSKISKEEKAELKKKYDIGEYEKIVLAVSKLNEREAPWDLLHAFKLIDDNVHLLIAGDGELKNEMERFARQYESKKITFVGYIKYPELPKYYGISDLFVHCSKNEPWGVSVQEAIASGLLVITSDKVGSGYDLIKENANGFIYAGGEISDLSYKIKIALYSLNKRDIEKTNSAILDNWNYKKILDTILNVIELKAY